MSEKTYTVTLNGTSYELNEDIRERIQDRARSEYEGNVQFSCWWKTASEKDAEDSDIHAAGDPILVIETEGHMVPWSRLDQLELEEQTTDSFEEFDTGDSGGGMKTLRPDDGDSDENREKERTHFEATPQDYEDVPSPEGEDREKVPAMPDQLDQPSMVMFVPDNPDIEHSWGAGEALAPMSNWVEWNVQAKADQPRITKEKEDSHDHWESLMSVDDCEAIGEVDSDEGGEDILDKVDEGGDSEDVPDRFEHGKNGGGHWNV